MARVAPLEPWAEPMPRFSNPSGLNWCAAALLGLISSTFSTLTSQLTAARIGRDAIVDWSVVAAIPGRDPMLQIHPSGTAIAVGIAFHQSADFLWALFFFGLLGRWTAQLRPRTILLIALPWALVTSATEWLVLVPLLPFRQPIFPLEQPYWIGFLVHATSASIYPLFPALRDWLGGVRPSPHRRFAAVWAGLAGAGLLGLGTLAVLGSQGRELPHFGGYDGFDRSYMRRMRAHHEQGVELAEIAAAQAQDPHLRALARMMASAQEGEIQIFDQWWRSWFEPFPELCSAQERAAMPGMLSPAEVEALRNTRGAAFDPLFASRMSFHHRGAIVMAAEAIGGAGDPRLRIMAHAIRHEQRGEIALMHGASGWPAVRTAITDLVTPGAWAPDSSTPGDPTP